MRKLVLLVFIFLLGLSSRALAADPNINLLQYVTDELSFRARQINEISKEIEKSPNNPELYVQRIKLMNEINGIINGVGECCKYKDPNTSYYSDSFWADPVYKDIYPMENIILSSPQCSTKESQGAIVKQYCEITTNPGVFNVFSNYSINLDIKKVLSITNDNPEFFVILSDMMSMNRGGSVINIRNFNIKAEDVFDKALAARPTKDRYARACLYNDKNMLPRNKLYQYCTQASISKDVLNSKQQLILNTLDDIMYACDEKAFQMYQVDSISFCNNAIFKKSPCEQGWVQNVQNRWIQECGPEAVANGKKHTTLKNSPWS